MPILYKFWDLLENKWDEWVDYFNKQWLSDSRFNNWQMFHVPPRFPNTNNAIESFHNDQERFDQLC